MALIDAETLESFRELAEGDAAFIREYFTAFLAALPEHLGGIEQAIVTQDPTKLASSAHAIKSSCANTGVQSLREVCAKLEAMGCGGAIDASAGRTLHAEALRLHAILRAEVLTLPEMKS